MTSRRQLAECRGGEGGREGPGMDKGRYRSCGHPNPTAAPAALSGPHVSAPSGCPLPARDGLGWHCRAELWRHTAHGQVTPASFRCVHSARHSRTCPGRAPVSLWGFATSPPDSLCAHTSSQKVHFVPFPQKSRESPYNSVSPTGSPEDL